MQYQDSSAVASVSGILSHNLSVMNPDVHDKDTRCISLPFKPQRQCMNEERLKKQYIPPLINNSLHFVITNVNLEFIIKHYDLHKLCM